MQVANQTKPAAGVAKAAPDTKAPGSMRKQLAGLPYAEQAAKLQPGGALDNMAAPGGTGGYVEGAADTAPTTGDAATDAAASPELATLATLAHEKADTSAAPPHEMNTAALNAMANAQMGSNGSYVEGAPATEAPVGDVGGDSQTTGSPSELAAAMGSHGHAPSKTPKGAPSTPTAGAAPKGTPAPPIRPGVKLPPALQKALARMPPGLQKALAHGAVPAHGPAAHGPAAAKGPVLGGQPASQISAKRTVEAPKPLTKKPG